MISAKATLSERLQGYEAGVDDYVAKPFDEDELLAKIRVYLRLKSVEEVGQLKTALLTLLSHETRTPLNGIIAPARLLKSEPHMAAAERLELLDMIDHSATRLHRLIEKVGKLGAMQSGSWDFHFEVADLCEAALYAVGTVAPQAQAHHVRIVPELPEAGTALVDWQELVHSLATLLDNAIRFSPRGGCVGIKAWSEAGSWYVAVHDQGIGIKPEALPYVFQEFASTHVEHYTAGAGLSLAIVRQTILAHHGTIDVTSSKGAGTTFTIRLPQGVASSTTAA